MRNRERGKKAKNRKISNKEIQSEYSCLMRQRCWIQDNLTKPLIRQVSVLQQTLAVEFCGGYYSVGWPVSKHQNTV
jgi:hypothetical protein